MLPSCTRTPQVVTTSHNRSDVRYVVLTDTLRVVDSIRVTLRSDTVWQERVREVHHQTERVRRDTVREMVVEKQRISERYVPRWIKVVAGVGFVIIAAWLLKVLIWLYRRR